MQIIDLVSGMNQGPVKSKMTKLSSQLISECGWTEIVSYSIDVLHH